MHMLLNESHSAIFARPCVLWTVLPCSSGYHLERGGMSLHDAVGTNCKRAQLLIIKVQVSSICAKGCMLDDGVCILILT